MSVDLNTRYGLNPAHSEVVEACLHVEPCQMLDMGCPMPFPFTFDEGELRNAYQRLGAG